MATIYYKTRTGGNRPTAGGVLVAERQKVVRNDGDGPSVTYRSPRSAGSKRRPNDPFDPRHVMRHPRVDAGRVFAAAVFPERRYPDLCVHADVVGVLYLQRAAGIALKHGD